MTSVKILGCSVACVLALGVWVAAEEQVDTNPSLEKLRSQKLAVLQDIVDRYRYGFERGKPVMDEWLAAEHQLLNTKLEMDRSGTERKKLLKMLVQNREKLVEFRIAGHKLGTNPEVDILHAQVSLLNAKIALSKHGSSE